MSLNEERSDQQPENMEEEDNKMDVEEASINLTNVKKELDESGEFDFDENRYRLNLNFDNIFGDSLKELRENKDSLIGFFDDAVVMETGFIKLEYIKDEEDLIREIVEQSYCNKCGGNYQGYCPNCSSLSHILNNLTPNINPDPILNTVPLNMLEVKEISTRQAVFALKTLLKGLILGPFEGVTPIESTTGLQWKIKDKKLVHNQNGNWMQYIESISNHASKNVDVFQFDGILYFETTRDIQEGEELLVCYREEKDEVVNKDNEEESYLIPVKKEKYPRVYACTICCLGFRLEKCLMEHKSKCQRGRGGSCEDFDVTQCRCCKVWLTKQEHLESHMLNCLQNYNRLRRSFSHLQLTKIHHRNVERLTPIDGSARDSTDSKMIRSKRSCGISGKTHMKRRNKGNLVTIHSNTSEKKYKCTECLYQTNHKSALNSHAVTHTAIKLFQCNICERKFSTKGNLKKHIKNRHSNSNEKEYKCSECSYQTNYKHHLKDHLNTHNGVRSFECDVCKKRFTQQSQLKVHIRTRHSNSNEKEYKCSECSYQTNYKHYLKIHIKDQHSNTSEKEYKCSECSYQTNYKHYLKQHLFRHSCAKSFECEICKRKFSQKGTLKRHIEGKHLNRSKKTHKCSECSYQANYKSILNRHILIHGDIRSFECNICKKKFTQKGNLNGHIEDKHLNRSEKKLKCSECSYQTNYKSTLNRHIVIHSDIRFECNICKKKFTQIGNLNRHIEDKHLNRSEKKLKCSECSYKTNYKSTLNRHIVIHSNIRSFECNICKKKFTQKGNLNGHIKTQH